MKPTKLPLAAPNYDNARKTAQLICDLYKALKLQMNWRMRDGSMCCCPAGTDEWEPKGKMPKVHATACEEARKALAKAEGRG